METSEKLCAVNAGKVLYFIHKCCDANKRLQKKNRELCAPITQEELMRPSRILIALIKF